MRTQIIVVAFVVCSSAVDARASGIINGDFETGDFTGWTVGLHATSSDVYFTGAGQNTVAPGGPGASTSFAKLKFFAGGYSDILLLNPPFPYTSVSSGADIIPELTQTFAANAGSILSFDVTWTATYTGNGPAGFSAKLIGPSGVEFSFDKKTWFYPIDFGDPPHSDWNTVSHILEESGQYTLRFTLSSEVVTGAGVASSSTIEIGVDNVTLTPVPEPSTLVLALGGLTIGGLAVLRRKLWRR